MPNVTAVNQDECTGCGACENTCPQSCVCLEYNQDGFYEPVIDQSLCTDCGQCLAVCLSRLASNNDSRIEEAKVYSAWSKSDKV